MSGLELSRYHGIYTPLVTPLHEDETIDIESLRRLVDFQIASGVHGLWAMGTTGEFASFDEDERAAAVEAVVSQALDRVPVIANISDAATRLAVRHAARAALAGASALALTPPYYYPSSQDELLRHFRAVAGVTQLPLIIYNIPQTVKTPVSLDTALTLAAEGAVAGIKDSQNNLEWFRELTLKVDAGGLLFAAFAGTRHLIDAAVLAGAAGAIPSLANAYPKLCVDAYESARAGDFARASDHQSRIVDLESQVTPGRASRNGAVIGRLKACLVEGGIIASAAMTRPLLAD